MSFDLTSISEQQSAEVELLHPVTGAPLDAVVILAGPEHPARKRLVFDRQRRLRAKFAKSGRLQLDDPAAEADEAIELLAACTLGWRGLTDAGKPLDYTPAAAAALYARPELAWMRAQLMAALDDRERFIAASRET